MNKLINQLHGRFVKMLSHLKTTRDRPNDYNGQVGWVITTGSITAEAVFEYAASQSAEML